MNHNNVMMATMTAPTLALFNALKTVMTETAASQAVQSIEQIVKTNEVEREEHAAQSVLYRVEKEIDSKIENEHKHIATKGDLMAVRTELKEDVMKVKDDVMKVKDDVMKVREDLMAARTELKEDVMKVREEIQKQNKSFITINVAIFAVIISILLYVVSKLP